MSHGRQAIAIGLLGAVLYVPALFRFGIWDPWEVAAADAGRVAFEGSASDADDAAPPLPARMTGLGFLAGGLAEWAGRLPLTLFCLLAPVAIFLAIARAWDPRAGLLCAIVLLTMPLFSMNALTMSGEGVLMTGHALAFAGFVEIGIVAPGKRRMAAGLAVLAAGLAVGLFSRGLLVGVGVPLAAGGLAAVASGAKRSTSLALLGAGVAAVAGGLAIGLRTEAWSAWAGGSPADAKFLSFEVGVEHVAHATFPWVAVLPIAIAWLVRGAAQPDADADSPDPAPRAALATLTIATLAIGFAAHAWHATRFGETPFAEVAALAVAAGLFLRHLEVRGEASVGASAVAIAVALLVVRDAGLFPQTALQPLALQKAEVPDGFVVAPWYGAAAALFLVPLHFTLAPGMFSADLRAPYRALARGVATLGRYRRAVLSGVALVAAYLVVVAAGLLRISNVGRYAHLGLIALPFALAIVVALYQLVDAGLGRLGDRRRFVLPAVGLAVAILWLHAFLPVLSNQFSARETFETYERLRREGDRLAEYRVPGRSAAFYSRGTVEEIRNPQAGAVALDRPGRVFVVLARKELASLDQTFRRRTKRHLVVLDDRSQWLLLAANRPIPGARDLNPIARFVRSSPTRPEHPVRAEIEGGKLVFEGYDVDPDGAIGAGESFTITWHWHVVERLVGNYEPFVHIDGMGQRLNGDHEPVDGLYPLRYWSEGDFILDRQTLRVPVNYRPGSYTIFLGFFQGSNRFEVTDGPNDGDDRIRAGVLRVR